MARVRGKEDSKGEVNCTNLPGLDALPDRLVSRRPLEGEGTRMAARKARDQER